MSEVKRKTKCIDDALLWSNTMEGAYHQATDICANHNITLNPDKFHFTEDVVDFAGFEITNTAVKPCRKYLRAIHTPKGITDVRSWFELINQVAFAFS